jgi:hypothetical protein
MFIEFYEQSEIVRKNRLTREAEQRKEEEEKKRREEHKIRYNEEVEKTIALTNIAQDYNIACKNRSYIDELESKVNMDDEKNCGIYWFGKEKGGLV